MATHTTEQGAAEKGELPSLTESEWQTSYRTGRDDLASDFYAPAMARATRIERTSGYFRSTVFALLYAPLQVFLAREGRMSLLCSPYLSADDAETFHALLSEQPGESVDQALASLSRQALLREVESLSASPHGHWHQPLLGGLIRHGFLDIRIALLRGGNGLFHEKMGIFHDAHGHQVSFKGSVNETFSGWGLQGNIESIDAFYSWVPEDAPRVKGHRNEFLDVWEGKYKSVQTLTLGEAVESAVFHNAPEDPEETQALLSRYQKYRQQRGVKLVSASLDDEDKTLPDSTSSLSDNEPLSSQWASGRVAEPHQARAINAWYEAGRQGIFEHATGSGKTFTALHIIRDHLRSGGVVLIVVPSTLLMKGWYAELSEEIPDAKVVRAGGGHQRWRQSGELEWLMQHPSAIRPLVLLATMQTAAKAEFRNRLRRLDNILLVADEVHQLGSDHHQQLLRVDIGARLGLSATPERYGDPDGTAALMHYFNGIVGETFTLRDAMLAGRLTQYLYHPVTLSLTAEEAETWEDLTDQLRQAIQRSSRDENGKPKDNHRTRMLKIRRSRIAKKAQAKIDIAKRVVSDHYELGQHWLVYCEDQDQLYAVATAIAETGIAPWVYHSEMEGDPDATLAAYRRESGVLVSIRCLDEGVDIPEISHAVILASSQNPRQFIQRRGRVLRRSPGKLRADIWDALVLPPDMAHDIHGSLTRSELLRAIEFAENAANQGGDVSALRQLAIDLGMSVDEIYGLAEVAEEDE